jgi:hypothetical protein
VVSPELSVVPLEDPDTTGGVAPEEVEVVWGRSVRPQPAAKAARANNGMVRLRDMGLSFSVARERREWTSGRHPARQAGGHTGRAGGVG